MSIITHRPNNVSQLDKSLPLIFFSFFYLLSNSQSNVVAQHGQQAQQITLDAFLNYTQYAEHMEICAHVEYIRKLLLSMCTGILSITDSAKVGKM